MQTPKSTMLEQILSLIFQLFLLVIAVFIIFECFLGAKKAFAAVTIQTADMSVLLAWEPPDGLELVDGPVPVDDIIYYQLYYRKVTAIDPIKWGDETVELTKRIIFGEEGFFYVGVSAIREIKMTTDTPLIRIESEITWSDNPAQVLNGEVFGIAAYSPTTMVNGFRRILDNGP